MSIWGKFGNYRQTINDNILVVIMIETPTGVANAFDIASVPGVDVVIIGNNDLSSFSGYKQGSPEYEALMKKVHDDVLRAGKVFGQGNAMYLERASPERRRKILPERQIERRLCACRKRRPRSQSQPSAAWRNAAVTIPA